MKREVDSERAKRAVTELLEALGFDTREGGIRETPRRVVSAWKEMLCGYDTDPKEVLSRRFESKSGGMVVLTDISFHSTCEHHLLPFSGSATVAYLPSGEEVVGISKLARLVDCYAKRLQLQENMTDEVADALYECFPKGAAVVIEARHLCMVCRGVSKPNAVLNTTALRGAFDESSDTRQEFMRWIKR
jgi:GTP cyclohydrolase I